MRNVYVKCSARCLKHQMFPFIIPCVIRGFPGGSAVKNPPASPGDTGDRGLIPGSGRSSGGGNGNQLQFLAWESSWTEEPGRLQSTRLQGVGRDWGCSHTHMKSIIGFWRENIFNDNYEWKAWYHCVSRFWSRVTYMEGVIYFYYWVQDLFFLLKAAHINIYYLLIS